MIKHGGVMLGRFPDGESGVLGSPPAPSSTCWTVLGTCFFSLGFSFLVFKRVQASFFKIFFFFGGGEGNPLVK